MSENGLPVNTQSVPNLTGFTPEWDARAEAVMQLAADRYAKAMGHTVRRMDDPTDWLPFTKVTLILSRRNSGRYVFRVKMGRWEGISNNEVCRWCFEGGKAFWESKPLGPGSENNGSMLNYVSTGDLLSGLCQQEANLTGDRYLAGDLTAAVPFGDRRNHDHDGTAKMLAKNISMQETTKSPANKNRA